MEIYRTEKGGAVLDTNRNVLEIYYCTCEERLSSRFKMSLHLQTVKHSWFRTDSIFPLTFTSFSQFYRRCCSRVKTFVAKHSISLSGTKASELLSESSISEHYFVACSKTPLRNICQSDICSKPDTLTCGDVLKITEN